MAQCIMRERTTHAKNQYDRSPSHASKIISLPRKIVKQKIWSPTPLEEKNGSGLNIDSRGGPCYIDTQWYFFVPPFTVWPKNGILVQHRCKTMASIKYRSDKKRWQVCRHATCPDAAVAKGSRFFYDKGIALTLVVMGSDNMVGLRGFS